MEWITPRTSQQLPFPSKDTIEREVKNNLEYLKDNSLATADTPAQGDILYYNGTVWKCLTAGTSGKFLKTQGAGANPMWDSVALTACTARDGSDVAYASPSGSRAEDTVYQNTSGKLRMVVITCSSSDASYYYSLSIGAANPPTMEVAYISGVNVDCGMMLVPPSYYYKVTQIAGAVSVTCWVEYDLF